MQNADQTTQSPNTALATAPEAGLVTMGFGSAQSFETLLRISKMFAASTMVPTAYQGVITKGYGDNITYEQNPAALANCAIALDMATRMNANPLMIMQNLHIIEGRPSWSSQFIIAAINNCGKFSPLRFDLQWGEEIDATYSTYEWIAPAGSTKKQKTEVKHTVKVKQARCVAWAIEKETGARLESAPVTMEMAVNEGWYGKNGSKWRSMPDLMLRYRSAAFFGRIYAPELLMGLPTAEETADIIDVAPTPDGSYAMPETPPAAETGKPRAPRAKAAPAGATAGPNASPEASKAAATANATDVDATEKSAEKPAEAAPQAGQQGDIFEPLQESQIAFITNKMEQAELGSGDFQKRFGKTLAEMACTEFSAIVKWISDPVNN